MGDVLFRRYQESGYTIFFDRKSGVFIRMGNSGDDPFFNSKGPELLDISITNYCEKGCSFCYRASNPLGQHMELKDYCRLLEQAQRAGVLQIALGGGNPNQHPDFIRILEQTRRHSIIPSYTTNGQGMTEEIYRATKELCGALAVSWYAPYLDAKKVISKCKKYGIKVNIHFLLSKQTIREAIRLLQEETELLQQVNAIIFLNYKPIHSTADWCLTDDDNLLEFLDTVNEIKDCKIGFDSCMISYLTISEQKLVPETVEFCEAARFSAFIAEDSFMYPCSFMRDTKYSGIDLTQMTLQDAWQTGELFLKMRNALQTPGKQEYPIDDCSRCNQYVFCHGGCQIFNINKCRKGIRDERNLVG